MQSILDSKFKAAYVKIIKIDNFRKNRAPIFACRYTFIWVFAASLPKVPQYLNTCKTSITRYTEDLYTGVRSHLVSNKKLKTLDYFSCVSPHDLGSSLPKLSQYPCTCKTGIARLTGSLETKIRSHLMRNKKLKTLNYLSYVLAHYLAVSPNCSNTRVPEKQV